MKAPFEHDPQSFAILGAAMEVHSQLGPGFLEPIYQDALACEFDLRQIPYEREASISVRYKGNILPHCYRADFVCYGELLVELKAVSTLTSIEVAQLLNYEKATGLHRGLLVNFGAKRLEFKRLVYDYRESADAGK